MAAEAFTPPVFRWEHADPELWGAAAEAVARAESGALLSAGGKAFRSRLLRALAVRSAIAAADLSNVLPPGQGSLLIPDLSGVAWPTPEHKEVAAGLMSTFAVLTHKIGPTHAEVYTMQGEGAQAVPMNAASPWAWVAVAVVGAAAYCYTLVAFGEETTYVADRALKRRDVGDKLFEVHASLLKLAEQHTNAERVAQKTLPMNAVELEVLAALKKEQAALLGVYEAESPTKKPTGLGDALKNLGLLTAAGVAVYLLTQRGNA